MGTATFDGKKVDKRNFHVQFSPVVIAGILEDKYMCMSNNVRLPATFLPMGSR